LHRGVAASLAADTFFLALYDEVSRTVEVVRQVERGTELPGGHFPIGEGVTSEAILTRRPRLIRQWSQEAPRVRLQYASGTPGLPESSLIVPLVFGDRVLGVLAAHGYLADAFDEDDLRWLEAIATQVSAAVAALQSSQRLHTQLNERVSELQEVVSMMADGLLIIDRDGRLTDINRAACDLLCLDDTSVVLGQPLMSEVWGQWPLGAHEITAMLTPVIEALQRGERPDEVEVKVERNGRRVLTFNGTPLFDARGAPSGAVLVVHDITSRREVDELKDEMLSVASHELRTPVTVIRAQAQLMRRCIRFATTSLEEVDEGLVTIVGETERLTHLLSLLLDMSRIQAGRLDISRRSVDLGKVAAAVVAQVQTTTERHQILLRRSGHLTGHWDESRLQQVIANLLTNAIKYSPDGGAINVTVRGDATDVQVSVRDHGVGLTPHEAEHVFERFFRAASIRQLEGSGLGLYICQSIVTAHGGRIWVESEGPGHGTAFSFVLHKTNPREYLSDEQPSRLTQGTRIRTRRNGAPNASVPPTSKRAELTRA